MDNSIWRTDKMINRRSGIIGAILANIQGRLSYASTTTASRETMNFVTLDLVGDASLIVDVKLKGRSIKALVDTGAHRSVVDTSLAADLRIPALGAVGLRSDFSTAQALTLASIDLEFAGKTLRSLAPLASDLSGLEQTVGRRLGMIVGQDVLAQEVVELNIPSRRLGFLPHTSSRQISQSIQIHPGPHGRLCFAVDVNGVKAVPAVLDLGSSNAVMMSSAFAERNGLLRGRKLSTAATGTLTGVEISTLFSIDKLSFGGFSMADVPADSFGRWTDPEVPLNVGLPILSRFDMVLDISASWMSLSASPTDLAEPFQRNRSGLGLAFLGDRLRVVHVAKNSPAEEGGWMVGDEIIAINGQHIDNHYTASAISRWRNQPPGSSFNLSLSDGSSRVLVLRRYY